MSQSHRDPGFTSSDQCPHGAYELRRRTYANGVVHLVYQCLWCGAAGRSAKKEAVVAELGGLPDAIFDEGFRDAFDAEQRGRWAAERERRDEERRNQHAQWWADYDRYLLTPEWRRKADRRLAFDRWQCQARLDGCTKTATQAHHLTYKHLREEPLFDIVSICKSCHDRTTAMDRARQNGVADVAAD